MATNSTPTGDAGRLQVIGSVNWSDAPSNRSSYHWELWLNEDSDYGFSWTSGVSAAVAVQTNGTPQGNVWSGSFGFDWRPAGLQSTLIATGDALINHRSDGSADLYIEGSIGATGTSGAGGPAAVGVWVPLPTLKVTPNTPTGVTGLRVSDSQAKVTWSQSNPSNGAPTSNTVQKSVNGGPWTDVVTVSATTTATVSVDVNQKLSFRVRANNSAGSSGWSTGSAAIFTTPAAPSNVTAARNASLNIVIGFTSNVAYVEHSHVITHGTVTGGVTTWDGSPLVTLPAGTVSYTHTSPSPSAQHVYRVAATAGALSSAGVVSGAVQLLAPPNAPYLAGLVPFADKAADLLIPWSHNPVDSTPQAAYEMKTSTDGGATWATTGKVTSTTSTRTVPGGTYTSGVVLQVQVRTWGQASTGGSDGAGASPWSSIAQVTFKTKPTVTLITPGGSVGQALVQVQISFTQPEGAAFVSQTIELVQDSTVVETLATTELAAVLTTRVPNGGVFTVRSTVTDSNGLTATATQAFTVTYLSPVAAAVELVWLEESGFTQIGLTIPPPTGGAAEAVKVTVLRTIDGVTETIIADYTADDLLTFIDTTPTVHGTNIYTVRTISLDGASNDVTAEMAILDEQRAFLGKGGGFEHTVSFLYMLKFSEAPKVEQALVKAAGRSRPIGLYGKAGELVISGTATVYTPDWGEQVGSTPEQIKTFLLNPGRVCYRDPSGNRIFGQVEGSLTRNSSVDADLSYTVTETSS